MAVAPHGIVEVFDLERALTDPAALDGPGVLPSEPGIESAVVSACWLDGDLLAVATGGEFREGEGKPALGSRELGVWSLGGKRWVRRNRVGFGIGALIPRGDKVVSSSRCTGTRGSSMSRRGWPVAALHPDGRRRAVAQPESIAIIALADKASQQGFLTGRSEGPAVAGA
ncbi:hypothetical protein [Streptomyces sp. NPDC096013]|uniref:hypothetical protein n=1 Tax=Streptomyces sp. NPDC096013 TaxID=3366069 RepID=UPI003825C1A7